MLEDKLGQDWTHKRAIFRYGMPCVEDRRKLGIVSDADYETLLSYKGKEDEIPDDLLLVHFRLVLENIEENTGVAVDDYFMGTHNHKIDSRQGNYAFYPEAFCQSCVSRDAVVKDIAGEDSYIVKAEGHGEMKVSGKYLPFKVEAGKKVRIHRGHIVKEL